MKQLLRYAPRRAVFHRYPFVGRFAGHARQRGYLWSMKSRHVRPAIYLGSVITLWPILGMQLLAALVASIVFRANFMVAGLLQFVSNPLTAPLYYFTYLVGKQILGWMGRVPAEMALPNETRDSALVDAVLSAEPGTGFTGVLLALFIGGTVCGLAMGLVIDAIYLWGRHRWRLVPATA
ncbi:hypothetical protein DB354_07670 [Opitutus sp. ER46]|nr:hypothetical protein DB354_07670 [Opitutus sp. ER46]